MNGLNGPFNIPSGTKGQPFIEDKQLEGSSRAEGRDFSPKKTSLKDRFFQLFQKKEKMPENEVAARSLNERKITKKSFENLVNKLKQLTPWGTTKVTQTKVTIPQQIHRAPVSIAQPRPQLAKSEQRYRELVDTEGKFHEKMKNCEKFWETYCNYCNREEKPYAEEMLQHITVMKKASEQLFNELQALQGLKGNQLLDALYTTFSNSNYDEYANAYAKILELEYELDPQTTLENTKDSLFKDALYKLAPSEYKNEKDPVLASYGFEFSPALVTQRIPRHKLLASGLEENIAKEAMKEKTESRVDIQSTKLSTLMDNKLKEAEARFNQAIFNKLIVQLNDYATSRSDLQKEDLRNKILKAVYNPKMIDVLKQMNASDRQVYEHAINGFLKELNKELTSLDQTIQIMSGISREHLQNKRKVLAEQGQKFMEAKSTQVKKEELIP